MLTALVVSAILAQANVAATQEVPHRITPIKVRGVRIQGMIALVGDYSKLTTVPWGLFTHERIAICERGTERPLLLGSGLNDLRGRLTVYNEDGALQYVRLRTQPWTYNAFLSTGALMLEIIPDSERAHINAFDVRQRDIVDLVKPESGDFLGLTSESGEGYLGMIRDGTAMAEGWAKPVVTKVDGGFHVVRDVVIWHLKAKSFCEVVRITERVGEDGSYEVVDKRILHWRDVRWTCVFFEEFRGGTRWYPLRMGSELQGS